MPTISTSKTSSTARFSDRANARLHGGIRAVPAARLGEELRRMRPLPQRLPATAPRWVLRVPAQPFLRFDTNAYSLDPKAVGHEVRTGEWVSPR